MTYALRITATAAKDIAQAVTRSRADFGKEAARRYESLITETLINIASAPHGAGSHTVSAIRRGLLIRHLASSNRSRVKHPRHIVAYLVENDAVHILRVLHESMDLPRHL
ncbi:MAG: type II toxin-antitoxin system RelE/ParE family toxin [Microbacterium gubbeenense]|uniref:type II toxin-antitoxin system RelE/ParE family toxin n=1 Tax=Microbacterium gubbeenense TaxID=159896 RepID=UPI003F9C56E9